MKNGVNARFTSDGVNTTVYYDKKGHWTGSLKGYYENKLPPGIRKMVRQEYYDYKITYAQEIETADDIPRPTYIIHIEGDKDFKLIRINDGVMDVYEEYKRNN